MDKNVGFYEIRIAGHLDGRWSDWFSGVEVALEDNPQKVTVLSGYVDQAALRGILNKLWDLNLTLLSVKRIDKNSEPNQ